MTTNKAQKRAIRTRMGKTGERYAAARRHLIGDVVEEHSDPEDPAMHLASPPAPVTINPGMSDEAIQCGSGKRWDEWLAVLDAWGASGRTHKEIAAHVVEAHGVDAWYAQSVAVGYERMRGLRQRGQRCDGTYSGSASKTFAVPVARLFAVWTEETERERWLDRGMLRLRTTSALKSARFDDLEAESIIAVTFVDKGPAKASVQVQNDNLSSKLEADEFRATWKEWLATLKEMLAEG